MATTFVHYTPAQNVTAKAAADVEAGTFVRIAGPVDGRNPVIEVAAAGDSVFGVPAHDCAAGEHVMVYRSGHIVDVKASGSITAGAPVAVGANGRAAALGETGVAVGLAVSASANGTVQVALN